MLLEIDWFFQHADWWHVLSIPVFTGVVGWTCVPGDIGG